MPGQITDTIPELPVADVVQTQEYYRDKLGFEIAWNWEDERGGVSCGNVILFFVQQDSFEPRVTWISSTDVDAVCAEWWERGATIIEEPEDKPWQIREFTMQDLNGHHFRVYRGVEEEGEDG